jgi:hypothetical protein
LWPGALTQVSQLANKVATAAAAQDGQMSVFLLNFDVLFGIADKEIGE